MTDAHDTPIPPMSAANCDSDSLRFLSGGGEMGALMRAHDWSSSPLGPPATWPQTLRTAVRLLLSTGHPMYIWWGPQLVCLYNDAYRRSIGPEMHPSSLGHSAKDVWHEIWHIIGPQIEQVMAGLGATWNVDHLVPITRNGARENVYWTYSYSPIDDDDAPNNVGGVLVICTETTEKTLLRQRSNAEIERQRRKFEMAPGFIAILSGQDHIFEFANNSFLEIVGGRNLINRSVREAMPDLEGQGFFELLDQTYATGERFIAKQTLARFQHTPDGPIEERYLDFIYQPITNEMGEISGIFVEGHDVTEEHLAREGLKRAEQSLRELAASLEQQVAQRTAERDRVWRNSRDLLVVMEGGGHFRAVNPAWTSILGYQPEEIVSRNFLDLVCPEDASLTQESLQSAFTKNDRANFEHRCIHKDGTMRWISWRTSTEDNLIYAYGRDITAEKKAAEELHFSQTRLRDIFETSYQYQGLLALDGTLLDANQTALKGVNARREDVIGKSIWESPWFAATPELATRIRAAVALVARGQTVRQEIFVDLPIGWRWFDFSMRPMRNQAGEIIAIVPEAVETTERRRAEEALRQSQKLEAMGQLTGGVAHDFNNLLTPIIGGLDILHRRGIGGPREQRLIDGALQSAERAKTLVQRLLAFARRQPLQPTTVDIKQLITNMKDLVVTTTGPKINVEINVPDGLPSAWTDTNQLEMAILNLAVNARDAMPDGGVLRITATASTVHAGNEHKLEPGDYIRLSVADTGAGMDASTLTRAIEPFFSTKGIGKGTGLGLSMVHGLASQLGGALVLSSRPGHGTDVALWLPAKSGPADIIVQPSPAMELDRATGSVMLVDDEAIVRMSTADMLAEMGYRITEAGSAEEAMTLLENGAVIDVLITDHMMPGMAGVDLARLVREKWPQTEVLIVTGFAETGHITSDLPSLTKPFRHSDLAASIARLMAKRDRPES